MYLKMFFEFYGPPLELGTDNGREFINPAVINYLNKNNIKLINGCPYNPRSQGAVERIHNTIRNIMLGIFLDDINNFNLENALLKAVNIYNNNIHRITKFSPNEIFYSNNQELFKCVYNNILNNYNNSCIKDSLFKKEELCLLLNNFIKTKNKSKSGNIILLTLGSRLGLGSP